eukprot:TRINITY_DN704_c0_g1_i2.p1 TRINITY_DN704_c0_g1~~TRINITY_DN704_c0_g1_i2.p1  ORF type:complete len:219 (+),score=51.31 TRINITY_DN704_c0_g1_i2:79-735(+)
MFLKVLLVASLFVLVFAQKEIPFVAQFVAVSYTPTSNGFISVSKATTQIIETRIDPTYGIRSDVTQLIGTKADATLIATFGPNNTYSGSGNMTFGTHLNKPNSISFRTYDGEVRYLSKGGVAYSDKNEILTGTGIFASATGLFVSTALGDISVEREQTITYAGTILLPYAPSYIPTPTNFPTPSTSPTSYLPTPSNPPPGTNVPTSYVPTSYPPTSKK